MTDPNFGADPELKAMALVLEALSPLSPELQERVLQWAGTRLNIPLRIDGLGGPQGPKAAEGSPVAPRQSAEVRRPLTNLGTISNVALKLGADSCRTIMIAAATYLSLVDGKESFTRTEWIECAREARGWKADYNSQLPTIIARLITSKFVFEKARDVFAVTELGEMEAKLAS